MTEMQQIESTMKPANLAMLHWCDTADKRNPYQKDSKEWIEYEDEWMKINQQFNQSY